MLATTSVHTGVEVCVWARSTTWVANEMLRVFQTAVHSRGLSSDYMHEHFDDLLGALRYWISGRYLHGATLEIFDGKRRLLERYDLALAYQPRGGGGQERFQTQLGRLQALLAARSRLPEGCRYRVVVDLEADAPDLPGWSLTDLADASHLQRQDVGAIIDTARIGVQFEFWG